MANKLIELPFHQLLDKFGAGNHKPGSGSAAALLGLMSCKLIQTVSILTLERAKYTEVHARVKEIKSIISDEIEPFLKDVFQNDSDQFHEVILLREQRDAEQNLRKWIELKEAEKAELKIATKIPLNIAEKCIQLAEFAIEIFDIGFKHARGDSGVAINSAISGAIGASSIIYLNLIRFNGNQWALETITESHKLMERASDLHSLMIDRIDDLKMESTDSSTIRINELRNPKWKKKRYTPEDIESIVRNFQNELWQRKSDFWKNSEPKTYLKSLDPEIAIKSIGYSFEKKYSLGQNVKPGDITEIAGIISTSKKTIQISEQLPMVSHNFTSAHELGHAILHQVNGLHRDRELNGAPINEPRDRIEIEADKFAVFFLMPKKLVLREFQKKFDSMPFVIDENSEFALGFQPNELRKKCKKLRDLSRIIAKADNYSGRFFPSIADTFKVSIEAMAIRLEELNLVEL